MYTFVLFTTPAGRYTPIFNFVSKFLIKHQTRQIIFSIKLNNFFDILSVNYLNKFIFYFKKTFSNLSWEPLYIYILIDKCS